MLIEINKDTPEYPKLKQAVEIMKKGGIIVYPTDTIYGLGADALNPKAIEKIFKIKQKPISEGLSFIIPDLHDISKYAIVPDTAFRIMKMLTPGPYTFVLKASKLIPKQILPKRQTVGIRIPDSPVCIELTKMLGNPIISTSANISGQPYYTDPLEIEKELDGNIDLILAAGVLKDDPSTVLDLTNEQPVVLRQGKGDVSKIL